MPFSTFLHNPTLSHRHKIEYILVRPTFSLGNRKRQRGSESEREKETHSPQKKMRKFHCRETVAQLRLNEQLGDANSRVSR